MDKRKISAVCATVAALAALCVPGSAAFAADGTLTLNAGDGSTLAGHSFTVYKLANYTDVVKDGANVKSVSAKHPDQATGDWIAAAKADKVMASTGANTNGMLLAAVALTGIGWTMLDMKRRRMDVTARHSTR